MAKATTSPSLDVKDAPCIAYLRAQDESGLALQRGMLKDYLEGFKLYLERTYYDLGSATIHRESFERMLNSLECENKIRILTISIDRLGRDTNTLWRLAHLIKSGHIESIITLEKIYRLEDFLHVDLPRFIWEEDTEILRDCVYTGINPLDVPPGGDPKKILQQRLASKRNSSPSQVSQSPIPKYPHPTNPFGVPPSDLPV